MLPDCTQLGAIWRRQRLSCPDRSTLQAYVANQLDAEIGGLRFVSFD